MQYVGPVIALVVVVLLAWLEYRYRASEIVRLVVRVVKHGEPARLRLAHRKSLPWKNRAEVMQVAEQLHARGFRDAGLYAAEDVPGVRIYGLANPEIHAYAAIYEFPMVGINFDIASGYTDDTSFTATTAKEGGELTPRPGHVTIRFPGADVATVYNSFMEQRPGGEMKATLAESFVANFQKAYADGMDWRNARGGATEEEVRAGAAMRGEQVSDDVIRRTVQSRRKQAVRALQAGLVERYMEEAGLSPAERDRLRPRLVAVHDQLPPDDLLPGLRARIVTGPTGFNVSLPSPREQFIHLNNRRPEGQRWVKIAELAWPLETDIYQAPG